MKEPVGGQARRFCLRRNAVIRAQKIRRAGRSLVVQEGAGAGIAVAAFNEGHAGHRLALVVVGVRATDVERAGSGIAERAGGAQGIGLNEHVRQARYGELDQCRVGAGWHLDLQRDFCAAEIGRPVGARSIACFAGIEVALNRRQHLLCRDFNHRCTARDVETQHRAQRQTGDPHAEPHALGVRRCEVNCGNATFGGRVVPDQHLRGGRLGRGGVDVAAQADLRWDRFGCGRDGSSLAGNQALFLGIQTTEGDVGKRPRSAGGALANRRRLLRHVGGT